MYKAAVDVSVLNRALEGIPEEGKKIINKAIVKTIAEAESLLRRNTPKDKKAPHIVNTIRSKMDGKFRGYVFYGSAERPAGFLEYGHKAKNGRRVLPVPVYHPVMKVEHKKYKGRTYRAMKQAAKLKLGIDR